MISPPHNLLVIQIFLTGHGGDGFIKVQDVQELVDQDLADALQQMHEKKR
jgi:phosphatidylinositol glycan class K